MPRPRRKPGLDETDLLILKTLRRAPSKTLEDLAREVEVAHATLKKRIARLQGQNLLRRGWIVRADRRVYPNRYLVNIYVNIYELSQNEVLKELKKEALKKLKNQNKALKEESVSHATIEDLLKYVSDESRKAGSKVLIEEIYETFGEPDMVVELLSEDRESAVDFIVGKVGIQRGVERTTTQPAILWGSDTPDTPSVSINGAPVGKRRTAAPTGVKKKIEAKDEKKSSDSGGEDSAARRK